MEDDVDSPNQDAEVLRDHEIRYCHIACFDAGSWLLHAMCCASGGGAQTEGVCAGAENATDEIDIDKIVCGVTGAVPNLNWDTKGAGDDDATAQSPRRAAQSRRATFGDAGSDTEGGVVDDDSDDIPRSRLRPDGR